MIDRAVGHLQCLGTTTISPEQIRKFATKIEGNIRNSLPLCRIDQPNIETESDDSTQDPFEYTPVSKTKRRQTLSDRWKFASKRKKSSVDDDEETPEPLSKKSRKNN